MGKKIGDQTSILDIDLYHVRTRKQTRVPQTNAS